MNSPHAAKAGPKHAKRAKTAKKAKHLQSQVTVNRKARFDYHLGDELTCGLSLTGLQVRAIRDHHVQLKGSFITLKNGELWLNNLTLGAETTTNIRLLATKKQLATLARARIDGLQIVPLRLLAGGRYIKLVVATAESKKKYDKRETIKKRDLSRRGAYQW